MFHGRHTLHGTVFGNVSGCSGAVHAVLHSRSGPTRPDRLLTANRQKGSPQKVRDRMKSFQSHVDVMLIMLVTSLNGYLVD